MNPFPHIAVQSIFQAYVNSYIILPTNIQYIIAQSCMDPLLKLLRCILYDTDETEN